MEMNTYLTFTGNCREAMTFYKDCLGGELVLQTIGESPMADQMPEEMKNAILHATLINGELKMMASDLVDEKGFSIGNAVSMMLNCESESQIFDLHEKLSAGGTKDHPLEDTFWGAVFGDLTDKFGHHWILNYQKTNQ